MLLRALTRTKGVVARAASPVSPVFGSNHPPFAPLTAQSSFFPPPVFPSAAASAPVVASKAPSSKGIKSVAPAPASATAPVDDTLPHFRLLKGKRTGEYGIVPQPFTLAPAPVIDSPGSGIRQSPRRRAPTPAFAASDTLLPWENKS